MIISSLLLTIVETKSQKTQKNSRSVTDKKAQKVRKHGEVCYHSVPHWEEKNGNFPCAKGLICRPPAKAKAPQGKPIAHKCFKDNKKNRVNGNITFSSKKNRSNEESYLFSITYRTPKRSGRENAEEGDFASAGEACAKSTPDFVAKQCVTGTTCRQRLEDKGTTGAASLCLPEELTKKGETCSRPISGYKTTKCVAGLVCRVSDNRLFSTMSGISSSCLEPVPLKKVNEACSLSVPCESGLTCKKEVQVQGKFYASDQPNKCHAGVVATINQKCSGSLPGDTRKTCAAGLDCRLTDDQMFQQYMTGISSYCLKPLVPSKVGEKCNDAKKCVAGLACNPPAANNGMVMKGATNVCQVDNLTASEGVQCANSSIQNYQKKICREGLVCRAKDNNGSSSSRKGAGKFCLPPATLGGLNEQCKSAVQGGATKQCQSIYNCQKKPSEINNKFANYYCLAQQMGTLNNVCSKPTPGFATLKCPTGSQCRLRDQDTQGTTLRTGISSYCVAAKPSIAREGQVCYRPTPGFVRLTCSEGLECKNTAEDVKAGKTGVSQICIKKNTNEVTVAGEGQDCAKATPGFTSKQCTAGTQCRPRAGQENMSGVTSICQKITGTINGMSIIVQETLKIGQTCGAGGAKGCPSGHACKRTYKSTAASTYCLLPSGLDGESYVPFVGLNNYCDDRTKPCTSGSKCTVMFDNSKICVARSYSYSGKPMGRRRK